MLFFHRVFRTYLGRLFVIHFEVVPPGFFADFKAVALSVFSIVWIGDRDYPFLGDVLIEMVDRMPGVVEAVAVDGGLLGLVASAIELDKAVIPTMESSHAVQEILVAAYIVVRTSEEHIPYIATEDKPNEILLVIGKLLYDLGDYHLPNVLTEVRATCEALYHVEDFVLVEVDCYHGLLLLTLRRFGGNGGGFWFRRGRFCAAFGFLFLGRRRCWSAAFLGGRTRLGR